MASDKRPFPWKAFLPHKARSKPLFPLRGFRQHYWAWLFPLQNDLVCWLYDRSTRYAAWVERRLA